MKNNDKTMKKESFIKQVYKELPEEYRDAIESIAVIAIIVFILGCLIGLSMFVAINTLPVNASTADIVYKTFLMFFSIIFGMVLIVTVINYAIIGAKVIVDFFRELQAAINRVEQKNSDIKDGVKTKETPTLAPKSFAENKKIMQENEMVEFINSIDRAELQIEIEELKNTKSNIGRFPRYLKAVKVTLISLGYDEEWVETVFTIALLEKYFEC